MAKPKERKLTGGKKQKAGDVIIEESTIKYVDDEESIVTENSTLVAKGTTTAHFVKFMSKLLDILDTDESLTRSYLVMDNCTVLCS